MIGTFYGQDFVRECTQLPAAFSADCGGATSAFRANNEGYIVWVGAGNQLSEGITREPVADAARPTRPVGRQLQLGHADHAA